MIGTIIAGIAGAGSAIAGLTQQDRAARERKKGIARQRAAKEAWYTRNYYQDYMNTLEAQNAINRLRNAWADRTQQERARQAVTGGTAEQAQAVAEVGGKAMAEAMGTLAAQGQQNKAAIDAQNLAMESNLSAQEAALAEAKEQAASNLISNGISVATSALNGYEPKAKAVQAPAQETAPVRAATTNTNINTPGIVGKEAGINPDLIVPENEEEYMFYGKKGLIR